jgi:hypothetical protein
MEKRKMHWPEFLAVVALSGVVTSLTDWLFTGVLFHSRYLIAPEIWRMAPGSNNTKVIIWSQIIGLLSSAALVAWLL